MKRVSLFYGVMMMFSIMSVVAHGESLKIKTPRGAELEVVIDAPATHNTKLPLIVIAPGQGYHMNLPLVQSVAEASVKNGFISYRFNWAYYSKDPVNGSPADDLSTEIEDMKAVLDWAKKDSRVDLGKVILAGKSLGSLVSYAVFAQDPTIAGLILMTPICTQEKLPVGEEAYPKFASQTRPVSMILGNQDAACDLPMLYDFIKSNPGNVTVNVFGGGHSLTFGKAGDPNNAEKDAKNIEAASSVAALWAKIITQK
jgi:alpha/beta superfamily hydrolase